MIIDEQFREIVENQLKALKWSRSDLARAMGRSPQYVGDYLQQRHIPGPKVMEEFFEALGLEPCLTVRPKKRKLAASA